MKKVWVHIDADVEVSMQGDELKVVVGAGTKVDSNVPSPLVSFIIAAVAQGMLDGEGEMTESAAN